MHAARRAGQPGAGLLAVAALLFVAGVGASAQGSQDAETLVRETTDKVLKALSTDRELAEDKARLFAFVNDVVVPHFDFERMSRRVLGKHWRSATEAQRAAFIDAFRDLLVRTYSTALSNYRDERIEFLPGRVRHGGAEATVRMTITQTGGPPLPISYEMGQVNSVWKVYDLAIDGASLVITYRTSFTAEIRKGGMDGLIDRLRRHNQGNA